jgi:hypothetical protein
MAKVGTSKAGGTISQQAAVHPWLAADAHGNKQYWDGLAATPLKARIHFTIQAALL